MHNLEIINGEASMFYCGEKPWHGLGTELEKPATSKEAIEAAKLNWTVEKQQLYLPNQEPAHNTFATVRTDNNKILGIVGSCYTCLQNAEAFEFFDSIVGRDAAIYHTAGALLEGKVVWILAKLPGEIRVTNDDITEKYLLLSNSHDGSSAVQIKFTPIRVVCNNTLTIAFADQQYLSVYHQKDIKARLNDVPKILNIVNKRYSEIEESFKELLRIQMTDITLKKYLEDIFPDPVNRKDEKLFEYQLEKAKANREWAKYFFENGVGNNLSGVKGSLWAVYNGVTELIDHKITKQSKDRKLNTIWFGDGAVLKGKAYKAAVEMVIK
ncbi:MAG: DUF932 domain-containing protein [Ignavibacteria bacterium]|nr:DUF932 domain-containing protein [Ignavibacteria bacterium]